MIIIDYLLCYSSAFLFGMLVGIGVMLFINVKRESYE